MGLRKQLQSYLSRSTERQTRLCSHLVWKVGIIQKGKTTGADSADANPSCKTQDPVQQTVTTYSGVPQRDTVLCWGWGDTTGPKRHGVVLPGSFSPGIRATPQAKSATSGTNGSPLQNGACLGCLDGSPSSLRSMIFPAPGYGESAMNVGRTSVKRAAALPPSHRCAGHSGCHG